MNAGRSYIAIDLKSFYASVECVERGLDPLDANLVVADKSRTDKTICLAVSPSLKRLGIGGRPRLFEVVQQVRHANYERKSALGGGWLSGKSHLASELDGNPALAIDYVVAPPRMALYMDYSTRIYSIYLKYIAPEDILVYSIDEVFIDATDYLQSLGMTAHQLAITMIRDVLLQTGVTATAGIGTNMYLAKVAMDIVAKKMPADADGVRIAELDEMSYRMQLWDHEPLTDFWRVGRGTRQRLAMYGIATMGDIAAMSIENENFLYGLFGVNAELLIDHAWGWESVTMAIAKGYKPEDNSLSSGQVLTEPYPAKKALVVVKEMAEMLAFRLLDHGAVASQVVLDIGYDVENVAQGYDGEVKKDFYGRLAPKRVHGSECLPTCTSSVRLITEAVVAIFERIVNKQLTIRRLNITACHVVREEDAKVAAQPVQLDLFADYEAIEQRKEKERQAMERERKLMETALALKKRFGKNALLRGLNYDEGATARERNRQIGGHKA